MKITRLETLEQFRNLTVGQTILVKWRECGRGTKPLMLYIIPRVQHQCNEIICDVKKNVYFNYKMHLGLDTAGRNTSNAREVYLIEDGESNEL
jgi:hypothetical protein